MTDGEVPNQKTIVGRKREIAELCAGIDDLLSGRGSFFLIAGQAGIGKTRLADHIDSEAVARGARVIWGRCWEGGGAPGFWPWIQILRQCDPCVDADSASSPGPGARLAGSLMSEESKVLVDRMPQRPGSLSPLTRLDPEAERFRLYDSIAEFLKRVAAATRLVIVIDDLHAADEDSVLLLRFLARDLRHVPIMLLVTCRDAAIQMAGNLSESIAQLGREGRTLSLSGLAEPDVGEFVEIQTGARADGSSVAALHQVTEGNPFFLTEIVRLLTSEGTERASSPIQLGRFRIPETIRVALRRRISMIPANAREVLSIASVVGREFDLPVLSAVAQMPQDVLGSAMEEAARAGLIDETLSVHGRYRFTHVLISETLHDDLRPLRRRQLHRQIAEILESIYADRIDEHIAELAHHFLKALPGATVEKAVDYAHRAAISARSAHAYEQAELLFRSALDALTLESSPLPIERCELLLGLGEAQYWAGDAANFRKTFQQAIALSRQLRDAESLARGVLGYAMLRSNAGVTDPTVVSLLEEALTAAADDAKPLRVILLARLAEELEWSGDVERINAVSREAVSLARQRSDPETLVEALYSRYNAIRNPDTLKERLDLITEVVALIERHRLRHWELRARYHLAATLLEFGDTTAARHQIRAISDLPNELQAQYPGFKQVIEAMDMLMRGNFAAAERLTTEGLSRGIRRPNMLAHQIFALQMMLIRREQGRLAEMLPLVEEFVVQYPTLTIARCALAFCHAESGSPDRAAVELQRLADEGLDKVKRDYLWFGAMALLAEVSFALQDRRTARELYDLLSPYAEKNANLGLLASMGPVAHYLGMLAAVLGDYAAAKEKFEFALRFNQAMGTLPWLTHTQLRYATMLLELDQEQDRQRARQWLLSAQENAAALEMKVFGEKATKLLEKTASLRIDERSGIPGSVAEKVPQASIQGQDEAANIRISSPSEPILCRESDIWTLSYGTRIFRIRDVKGLSYIAHLLAHPNKQFHAFDLMTNSDIARTGDAEQPAADLDDRQLSESALRRGVPEDAGEMLDNTAKAAYKRRLNKLREELDDAREFSNSEREHEIQEEIDALAKELSRAVGLGGRDRRAASTTERARINVTRAIRAAIEKIAANDESVAQMLSNRIRTGTYCSYLPAADQERSPKVGPATNRESSSSSIDAVATAAVAEPRDLSAIAAPDGTVAILFTDMKDSSALFDRLGDLRALEIVSAHNAMVREQVSNHKGFEVKSAGDGFMIVFSSARRAILCASAIQRAFESRNQRHPETPIQVRMGLHVGEAISVSADFFGKAVIIAARIAERAQGGEILVSSTLRDIVESAGDLRFKEAGEASLKGLSGTHRLYRAIWAASAQ